MELIILNTKITKVRFQALTPESKNLSMLTMFLRKPHSASADSSADRYSSMAASIYSLILSFCSMLIAFVSLVVMATRAAAANLNIY